MSKLDQLRNLPLKTRRNLALGVVIFISVIGVIVWASTDFGLSSKSGGLGTIKEGAGDVASLIQEQSDQFQEERLALEENLNQILKSSALIFPEGLIAENEEPDGVLYLGSQYREKGITTVLEQIEFYSAATLAYFRVTLETEQTVFLDAALGSALAQTIDTTGSEITLQPLFQAGTPAELKLNETLDVFVLFGPINGRQKIELVLGDFLSDLEPQMADRWSAHFSIDPAKIIDPIDQIDPINQETGPEEESNSGSVEPILEEPAQFDY